MPTVKNLSSIKSLYIHFPFCRHLCNYCDFYKKVPHLEDQEKLDIDYQNYQEYLEESFRVHQRFIEENNYEWQQLDTVYIGGGTPSLWGARGAIYLKNFFVEKGINLSSELEFTLEVNPGGWSDESLEAWRQVGVNRFSLGIQSLDERFLKALDRIHNVDDVDKTLEKFQSLGANFSVDFMLGLPFSDELSRDVLSELKEILKYNPSHISLYILTVKDNYVHIDKLPSEEWIEKEFLTVSEFLRGEGFVHYEVSNFSRPGLESKHNLEYWKSNSVGAMGPSATGYLSEAQKRYKWVVTRPEVVVEDITDEGKVLEDFYMAFRTNQGVALSDYIGSNSVNCQRIEQSWLERDLIEKMNNGLIRPTSKGYLVLDSLMNELFSL